VTDTNTALDDLFSGSGAPAFKFANVGDTVAGTITDLQVRQQTDFDSGELKVWDDGKPMMEIVITVATALRDASIEDDDGERRVFCRGAMLTALKQAVRAAKEQKPKVGAKVAITHSGLGEAKKKGFNAPKLYTVDYAAPDAMDAVFDEPVAAEPTVDPMAQLASMSPDDLAKLIAASTK
jgi:hypothetical protein